MLQTISKRHCKIVRTDASSATREVYLEDYSSNGTYVNGEIIGKGNKRILKNNDHISLASPRFKGTQLMMSMKTRNVLYRFEIYRTQSVLCVLLIYFNARSSWLPML